jgi:hypothetical protein
MRPIVIAWLIKPWPHTCVNKLKLSHAKSSLFTVESADYIIQWIACCCIMSTYEGMCVYMLITHSKYVTQLALSGRARTRRFRQRLSQAAPGPRWQYRPHCWLARWPGGRGYWGLSSSGDCWSSETGRWAALAVTVSACTNVIVQV